MSLRYLPEYAQIVIFSLELARKEAELAEKVGVLDSVDAFIVARKLRNTLVHQCY
ncbi:MAG: hypothetical protein NTY69_10465 [Methylococcales bacterium]|nr:hypothetical protein [Methylococcales bacterium]